MHKISTAICLITALSSMGGCAYAHTPVAAEAAEAEADNKAAAVERLVRNEMSARGIPGAQLTVVQGRKIVFTGAYGQTNLETGAPVTKQTIFGINSISKAVTGVAVMQLVEAGKLDLDAPLASYLKTLPPAWAEVSIRQALTHTSGLPEVIDDNARPLGGAEPEQAWAKVQELPLNFAPGTRFEYSQTNYVVVGKLIEKISGQSYAEFVRSRQFKPAGMQLSGFTDTAVIKPPVATLYTIVTPQIKGMKTVGVERSATPLLRHEPLADMFFPIGGIRTTSTDLAEWVIALQDLKLVNKSSLEQLLKPQLLKDGTQRGFNAVINGYGLGFPSIQRPLHPAFALTGGARAAVFIYPNDDLTVIFLSNLMGASPQAFIDKIAGVYLPGLNAVAK
ncbi:CubicO group peptidase (beta-lactamase class C family) [Paucibacter oligotrophus]|uniref:CubicO group peptidase (Beta-lactamase class C family) n=1 Tax=Roseateles oligotrophus TaxID=1769250 RepID=A0A840LI76_9BURK|nr:serine hydrolase domain-containing protein [Roseateles oligotrophus]MBB4845908.1 CubicO group peptidase (beta-lactamase class C family) [Roseateles oligotrophus]